MSDFKSKLPDLKELSSMTSKLYHGLKSSVKEIIKDYKDKRETLEEKTAKPEKTTVAKKTATTTATKPKVTKPKATKD